MNPTIADASTVDLNSPATWAVLAAAVILALAVLIHEAYQRAPIREPQPSRLDLLNGVGVAACHLRCSLPGTIERTTRPDLGLEVVRVCPGHSDEGDLRKWWSR